MFQFRKTLSVFFLFVVTISFAQELTKIEQDSLLNKVDKELFFAQKNIDNLNYSEAEKQLETLLESSKKLNNKKRIGLVYSKLGKLQFLLNNHDIAKNTLIKALEFQRLAKDNINIAETYITLGDVYLKTNKPNKAIGYYKYAQTYFSEANLYAYQTESNLKEGQAYLALNNIKKAESSFNETISLAKRYKLNKLLSSGFMHLAKAQAINGRLDIANTNINEAIVIAKKNKLFDVLGLAYLTSSNILELDENYKLANNQLKIYNNLLDSLNKTNTLFVSSNKEENLIISNQIDYQKQNETELETKANESYFNQLVTMLSIFVITALLLLTLVFYKNNTIKLNSNAALQKINGELLISKEAAELATKTKADFLSTVTHELRTPLYAVTGLTNMLLDENPKPEQIQHLKSLKISGDYLLTFINDILQINKIEAIKVDIEREVFNLKKKITNVISALNNSAEENNVKIHFDFDNNLPESYNSDQLKISQILINIIGNSIKFTKDGDIWVRVKGINNNNNLYNIRIEIQDTGIGISEEKQGNLFESFSQGSIQINRKYGGTGLGLSIVKGLVDILKGKIYIKSELGKGSTFFIELPLIFTKEAKPEEKNDYIKNLKQVKASEVKILVVEDNKINQMITKRILKKMDLNCDIVENGEDAVEKVKVANYDIVLMDIHMPGISGIEATKIIRTFNTELPIFALTAVSIEGKMEEFKEAGFTDIISKPFKLEFFEKKLHDVLTVSKNV